jgi:hypothetical protein
MAETRICSAITRSGKRCSARAQPGQEWCYNHDPARAEERRTNASTGGKTRPRRPPDELEQIKADIKTVSAAVLKGGLNKKAKTVDKHTAAVLFQGFNTLLRSIEIQRKLDHQQELEDQLAELRERLQEVRRAKWGA